MKDYIRGVLATVSIGLGIGLALFNSASLQLNTYAEDTTSADGVLELVYAGAAEDMEIIEEPSDEEIADAIALANAWKEPGELVMANVQQYLNVREEPCLDGSKVGVIYGDCGGYIVEYTDTWTKVRSGNVEGWVCNDYLIFGDEAKRKLKQ